MLLKIPSCEYFQMSSVIPLLFFNKHILALVQQHTAAQSFSLFALTHSSHIYFQSVFFIVTPRFDAIANDNNIYKHHTEDSWWTDGWLMMAERFLYYRNEKNRYEAFVFIVYIFCIVNCIYASAWMENNNSVYLFNREKQFMEEDSVKWCKIQTHFLI